MRTESKRRCSVYPVFFPTPSNSSLHGRSWMKISLSLSFFFLFLLFLLRFCYPHWLTAAVRSAIFSLSFLPPLFFFWNSTLTGEQMGGWGSLDRKWLNLPQCVSEPFLLILKLVMTDLIQNGKQQQKKRKKNENVYCFISSWPTFCLSP